ncbi:slit homolog 1 protein [Condylostylus longicornis]|uniref:slit homolog 1 protein n=1 Tax=Condylostylus longicornis TaxID=2530218 RepID=UPI00244DB511|nr:slit homolog 1 protein [Condylostylus longicornis]
MEVRKTCITILLLLKLFVAADDDDDISNTNYQNILMKNNSEILIKSSTPSDTNKLKNTKSTYYTKHINKISTNKKKNPIENKPILLNPDDDSIEWKCPNITVTKNLECGCDLPHTLRCSGDIHGLSVLASDLRISPYKVSLLDCSLKNVSILNDAKIFEDVPLDGLVISGEIKRIHKSAFLGLRKPLQALGLPGNSLTSVPWNSISPLYSLERVDLSNNKIKSLNPMDFFNLTNLIFLDISNNQITSISPRTFVNLRHLETLKLGGNRLGDFPSSLKGIEMCLNLRNLDLKSNNLNGRLKDDFLPKLNNLETLNLNRNLLKSIENRALHNYPKLTVLSVAHNQIDVLQDHAFYGLSLLETLDLSYNGIVAVSSASLQHLSRLKNLDLTHNFLRALTSDLIAPLPSLKTLQLSGNEISIVSKTAFVNITELTSLSLQENPLSCDCLIRPFAEWLKLSSMTQQDLESATCMTPPRLEGAPLIQISLDTLNCDTDSNIMDDDTTTDYPNVFDRMKEFANVGLSVQDLNEKIYLKDLHFSADYGLILTWALDMSEDEYTCDTIFIYKQDQNHEILVEKSPIHCESKIINNLNFVSVLVPDSSNLNIGESYRFCLVLAHELNSDLYVGCSNMTQLRNKIKDNKFSIIPNKLPLPSDIDDFSSQTNIPASRTSTVLTKTVYRNTNDQNRAVFDNFNKSFYPSLVLTILVISMLVLVWGVTKIRNAARMFQSPATICYSATSDRSMLNDQQQTENRYLKLQATTSL